MAESNDRHERNDGPDMECRVTCQSQDGSIPWRIVSFVSIVAVVLLVGLPVGAVLIVKLTGCCFTSGPENVITFWASMIAGFLTLFGMVVTGVFVLTAFKTKEIAKAEAQSEARKTAQEVAGTATDVFLQDRRGRLFRELKTAMDEVAEQAANVEKLGQDVEDIGANVKALHEQATEAITAAQESATNAAREAQAAIGEARDQTTSGASEAQEAIGRAREEAEAAARVVRERADRATGGPAQEDTPRQPDE